MLETVVALMMLQDPMPVGERLETFGSYQAAYDGYWDAKGWRDEIGKHCHAPEGDPFPSRWRPWCEWHYAEADRLYSAYDHLTNARTADRCNQDARACDQLRQVRGLIGERDYWTGHMPPVPVWQK